VPFWSFSRKKAASRGNVSRPEVTRGSLTNRRPIVSRPSSAGRSPRDRGERSQPVSNPSQVFSAARSHPVDPSQLAEWRTEVRRLGYELEFILGIDHMSGLGRLSPIQFEDMVLILFTLDGWRAVKTPQSADRGIDGYVEKNRTRAVVQCKHQARPVGEPLVRDFYGVICREGSSKGFFVTSGRFSPSAVQWVSPVAAKVQLIDGQQLRGILFRTQARLLGSMSSSWRS
jgi:HJR/Mrr/RecB family endonuclease